jgi:hypothetical protein
VKHTKGFYSITSRGVEDTIQNGVKHAKDFVEDIIKDKN